MRRARYNLKILITTLSLYPLTGRKNLTLSRVITKEKRVMATPPTEHAFTKRPKSCVFLPLSPSRHVLRIRFNQVARSSVAYRIVALEKQLGVNTKSFSLSLFG